jgi:uncharacterized glyoxalase superfamily protein PhnB
MASTAPPSIYPTLRYDDAPAAIRFLTAAFGLIAQEIDEGSDGALNHALMRHGTGLVMLFDDVRSGRDGVGMVGVGVMLIGPDRR